MKIRKDLILKYNQPGPRYTSYPPANFFHGNVSGDDYREAVIRSNREEPRNISLYVHIPFCPTLCHFCGCTTSAGRDVARFREYVDILRKEIETVAGLLDSDRRVTQIHWGGGTPNSLPMGMIGEIMDLFHSRFTIAPEAEIAMECSPAWLDPVDVDHLAGMGFNRLSLGIQDFNDDVLKIVNRKPSRHPVEVIANRMRQNGFKGLNLDLIYGLPGQNPDNFRYSIRRAIDIGPERLVTFSYAHVPWVNQSQKILERTGIPTADEKLELMEIAWTLLTENGYMPVGMDHYAKPGDDLYQALIHKKLHRNFQGYCTRETTGQVYGFGSSAISQLDGGYYQNAKSIQGYIDSIRNGGWAIDRGYQLSPEEKIIRTVINEVMCNLYLDFKEVADRYDITVEKLQKILAFDPVRLEPFIDDGLLVAGADHVKVESDGLLVVRNIAMTFDPNLTLRQNQYSRTI